MAGERLTCGCGCIPINADGLCATCEDERSMTGPSLSDELERVKRALADQQERFRDEPVMLRPDDVRAIISGIERLLEKEERMREALTHEFGVVESMVKSHQLHLRVGSASKHEKARRILSGEGATPPAPAQSPSPPARTTRPTPSPD